MVTLFRGLFSKTELKWESLRFPDCTDREFWDGLPSEAREELIKKGEGYFSEEYPALFLSDYREFSRTGNRVNFEDQYFKRREMLSGLVLAECVENKGRFLDKIMDGLFLILEETSWCLPAHNTYIRDAVQLPLPDPTRPVIDLFAAETAAIVAMTEYLLRKPLCRMSKQLEQPTGDAQKDMMTLEGAGTKTSAGGMNGSETAGEEIKEFSLINHYVDAELTKRIIVPYLTEHFWWMGNGEEELCNWTPWITQNVLLTVFTRSTGETPELLGYGSVSPTLGEKPPAEEGTMRLRVPEPDTVRKTAPIAEKYRAVLKQAASSLDDFLKDYGEDGCCSEGAQYYERAGLCLFCCIELLNQITDGSFTSVYEEKLIRNIAAYVGRMYVGNGYYFNFADCSPFPGRRTAKDYLFAKRTGNESYIAFVCGDFRNQSVYERTLVSERNLYDRLLQLTFYQEMLQTLDTEKKPEDFFFESTGLLTARNSCYALAVKAGNNGDSHNHNDVGSVTLYKEGKPFLIDLGVETYTKKTFSKDRYEIWTMQSAYHNTVSFLDCADSSFRNASDGSTSDVIDTETGKKESRVSTEKAVSEENNISIDAELTAQEGMFPTKFIMQKPGKEYGAKDVICTINEIYSSIRMDIAGAYGDGRVKSYLREVTLFRRESKKDNMCESKNGNTSENKNRDIAASAQETKDSILIKDCYEGKLPAVLTLMTYEEPRIIREPAESNASVPDQESEKVIVAVGDLGRIEAEGIEAISIEACPIKDERLKLAWKHDCYRILLKMKKDSAVIRIC